MVPKRSRQIRVYRCYRNHPKFSALFPVFEVRQEGFPRTVDFCETDHFLVHLQDPWSQQDPIPEQFLVSSRSVKGLDSKGYPIRVGQHQRYRGWRAV